MTWYKTGTVNVANNSATVTGAGTAFVANVQVGEEFRLAGGQRGYEITAVVSNTQLTIDPPYMDSSQNGASYRIVPVRGFLQRAYDAMSGAMSQWDDYRDGALSGLFDDGAAGDSGFGFAAAPGTGWYRDGSGNMVGQRGGSTKARLLSGGLDVTGLLTGTVVQSAATDETAGRLLKVGSFGLGGKTEAGVVIADGKADLPSGFYAGPGGSGLNYPGGGEYRPFLNLTRRSNATTYRQVRMFIGNDNTPILRYSDDNGATWADENSLYGTRTLLGSVSETGGLPTGAVIERAANANGEYVRLADGTQVCVSQDFAGVDVTTLAGSVYRNAAPISWTFPAAFTGGTGSIAGAVTSMGNSQTHWGTFRVSASTSADVSVFAPTSTTGRTVRAMAVGRWF